MRTRKNYLPMSVVRSQPPPSFWKLCLWASGASLAVRLLVGIGVPLLAVVLVLFPACIASGIVSYRRFMRQHNDQLLTRAEAQALNHAQAFDGHGQNRTLS